MEVDTALFGESVVRRLILRRFFSRPGVVRHVRELSRELRYSPAIVGKELDRLERAGVLTSERIGTARRYRVDERSPIASEIRSLVQKTIGIEARLQEALSDVPGIDEAFLFGSYARGEDRPASDLDLFVVGDVDQERLTERMSDAEGDLGRDVNLVVYGRDELTQLRDAGDRFVEGVFAGPRIPLLAPTMTR